MKLNRITDCFFTVIRIGFGNSDLFLVFRQPPLQEIRCIQLSAQCLYIRIL